MLAAGLILTALVAQTPDASGWVETASVSDDPFESLWSPDPDAPLPSAPRAPAGADVGPAAPGSAPRDVGPGAPRLDVAPSPPPPATVIQTTSVQRTYRLPIVVSDLLFATVAFIGFGLENAALVASGALGYSFAAPAFHWHNGNQTGGLLSLTMHSLGPAAVGLFGALLGAVANDGAGGGSDRPWFFAGLAVGVATTTLTDVFMLAKVNEPVSPIAAVPTISRVGDVTTFGVGGRF